MPYRIYVKLEDGTRDEKYDFSSRESMCSFIAHELAVLKDTRTIIEVWKYLSSAGGYFIVATNYIKEWFSESGVI